MNPQSIATNKYDSAANSGMSDLSNFDSNAKAPIDIYNAALETYGVNDARQSVQKLRTQLTDSQNLLAGVEPSVNARTSGSVVTESQRRGEVSAESAPISKLVGSISASLDAEMQNYGMVLSEAQKSTDYTVQGNQQKRQAILDQIKLNIELSQNEAQRQQWVAEYNQKLSQFNAQQALEQQSLAESVRHDKAAEAAAYYSG